MSTDDRKPNPECECPPDAAPDLAAHLYAMVKINCEVNGLCLKTGMNALVICVSAMAREHYGAKGREMVEAMLTRWNAHLDEEQPKRPTHAAPATAQ